MRHLVLIGLSLGGVVSCASSQPSGVAHPSTPISVAPEEPDNAETNVGDALDEPLPLESQPPSTASSRAAPAWSSTTVDIGEWCAERGIAANVQAERCTPAELGSRPQDTLWCFRREEEDDHRVVFFASLHQAHRGALRRLVEVAYAAAARPLEGQGPSGEYYVRLVATVADDGQSFELREDPELDCATAEERVNSLFHDDPAARQAIAPVVDRVCRSRGKYSAGGQRLE
jgi:hypothetical protein